MIRFVRIAKVEAGKAQEALAWAKEVAEHYRSSFGIPIQVFVEVFGENGTLCWMGDAEDIATLERNGLQWPEKPGFQELAQRGATLLVAGSMRDRLLRAS